VPIAAVTSPSHADDFVFVNHTRSYSQASLESEGGDLNRDVVVSFKLTRARTGFDVVPSIQPGEDGYFLLSLTVGDDELQTLDGGMDYVFVLDVSGSMDTDGKLALSRDSIGAFIDELGDDDRFEVVTFNVSSQSLFDRLITADDRAKADATTFLGSQKARGGTVLRPALDLAYRYKDPDRPLNVVILSDGMTEQQERSALHQAIAERPGATRVFAIGVGNEVNRPLLEQIAEDAGGLAAFISRGDDFTRQARSFRRKLLRPAASNIELDFQGGGVHDREPERLPDLFHGAPLRLYGRYREGGKVTIRFTADVGGERIERWVDIELPGDGTANPEIERMWAWHRVQRLLSEADRKGSRSGVADEIVRLGEGFSIVTEHTSFLVLENDAEYRRWQIERRNALRTERDRAHQEKVRSKLEQLRDSARADLGPEAAKRSKNLVARNSVDSQAQPAQPTARQPQRRSRGSDFGLGGGALDPTAVLLAIGVAALGLLGLRRRVL